MAKEIIANQQGHTPLPGLASDADEISRYLFQKKI
jgi:hypothetical protein